jgi:hypothetical protein
MFGFGKKKQPSVATVPMSEWLPREVSGLRDRINKIEAYHKQNQSALREIRDILNKLLETTPPLF